MFLQLVGRCLLSFRAFSKQLLGAILREYKPAKGIKQGLSQLPATHPAWHRIHGLASYRLAAP